MSIENPTREDIERRFKELARLVKLEMFDVETAIDTAFECGVSFARENPEKALCLGQRIVVTKGCKTYDVEEGLQGFVSKLSLDEGLTGPAMIIISFQRSVGKPRGAWFCACVTDLFNDTIKLHSGEPKHAIEIQRFNP